MPDDESASTLTTEYLHAPTIDRGSMRRYKHAKVDNRRGRWEIKEKEKEHENSKHHHY